MKSVMKLQEKIFVVIYESVRCINFVHNLIKKICSLPFPIFFSYLLPFPDNLFSLYLSFSSSSLSFLVLNYFSSLIKRESKVACSKLIPHDISFSIVLSRGVDVVALHFRPKPRIALAKLFEGQWGREDASGIRSGFSCF